MSCLSSVSSTQSPGPARGGGGPAGPRVGDRPRPLPKLAIHITYLHVLDRAEVARTRSRSRRRVLGPLHQRVPSRRSPRHTHTDPNISTAPRGPGPRGGALGHQSFEAFVHRGASWRSPSGYWYRATRTRSTAASIRPAPDPSGPRPSRRRPAVAASRRCTPTARKPAPTITHKPVVPRRPRPPASPMTRGPPRSAPCRIQLVLSARSKSQGRRPDARSPSPATCRESCGLGAATPRRYGTIEVGRGTAGRPAVPRGRRSSGFGARTA